MNIMTRSSDNFFNVLSLKILFVRNISLRVLLLLFRLYLFFLQGNNTLTSLRFTSPSLRIQQLLKILNWKIWSYLSPICTDVQIYSYTWYSLKLRFYLICTLCNFSFCKERNCNTDWSMGTPHWHLMVLFLIICQWHHVHS
jgi:hypothetical protein